jgi:hypothetical protein
MSPQSLIKQPAESRLYSMDFAGLLAQGETVTTVVSIVAAPTGLTVGGSPVASGNRVSVQISGGAAGTEYKVTFVVNTSAGNIIEGEGLLQVRDL